MSRSAILAASRTVKDATRFTATSPHAYSVSSASRAATTMYPGFSATNPGASASRSPQFRLPPGPPGETPKEKVERLRRAHRAAKLAAETNLLDRIIDRGRIWADRTHRTVVWFLMGATVISTFVTVFSLISLVMHHRTQRLAFVEHEMKRLHDARVAFVEGTADEDQLHLLEMERAGDRLMEERKERDRLKKERSLWMRFKRTLGLAPPATVVAQDEAGREEQIVTAVEEADREEKAMTAAEQAIGLRRGGPLDVMADNIVGTVKANTVDQQGWLSWTRRN